MKLNSCNKGTPHPMPSLHSFVSQWAFSCQHQPWQTGCCFLLAPTVPSSFSHVLFASCPCDSHTQQQNTTRCHLQSAASAGGAVWQVLANKDTVVVREKNNSGVCNFYHLKSRFSPKIKHTISVQHNSGVCLQGLDNISIYFSIMAVYI